MYWNEGDAAVSVMPQAAPVVSGQPSWFTGGNPQLGQNATQVTADWANTITAEQMAIVLRSGLMPDKTDNAQVMRALNMLGWFLYDNKTDYTGGKSFCIGSDGIPYKCMQSNGPASALVDPVQDTAGEYWLSLAKWLITGGESGGGLFFGGIWNKQEIIETSGIWTAPKTAWYKITIKGAGGGGGYGWGIRDSISYAMPGGGGGEGEKKVIFARIAQGEEISIIVGAAGEGATPTSVAQNGGNSSVTIDQITYTSEGGKAGGNATQRARGDKGEGGGIGITRGSDGDHGINTYIWTATPIAQISANGGGVEYYGHGGYGGEGASERKYDGYPGTQGVVVIEYFQDDTTEEAA